MRKSNLPCQRRLLPTFLFLGLAFSALAQPVPCGPNPDMTTTCIDACVICDIDGYTGINDDTEVGQAPPGFCTTVVHHMQWIAFIAGSTNLSISITPSNCNSGQGLEVGIYESLDCSTFNLVTNCDTDIQEGETSTFTNTQPLVIGQYYYFVMDGNQGDVCNYTIHVVQGSTMVPPLPPAGPVQGPAQVCQSDTATYSIAPITGANFYQWTQNGIVIGQGNSLSYAFQNPGTYNLCVSAFNVCDTVEPSCVTVQVFPKRVTNLAQGLCSGDCFAVADTQLCDPGNYTFHLATQHGCDSTVHVAISTLPAPVLNMQATLCSTDSLLIGSTWYYPPGNYVETLTAANGCDSTINLSLNAIICEISGSTSIQPIACHGDATGILRFSVENGTPPFTYTWQQFNGGLSGSGNLAALNATESIDNLPVGSYLVTIQDSYGNDVVLTASITEPPALANSFVLSDFNGYGLACHGDQQGTLAAMPQGGTPPYAFAWSNGSGQNALSGLPAGNYALTITDGVGCTLTAQAVLSEPAALLLSAEFTDPGCDGFDTGIAEIQAVSGGVPPYQYAFSGQDFGAETNYAGLTEGPYTLTVMDASGCLQDTSATLVASIIPNLEAGPDVEIQLGYAQTLQAAVDLVPQTIQWTPSTGLSCSDCLKPVASPHETTLYTLLVISKDGCQAIDSLRVRLLKPRIYYIPNAFSPNDDGDNDYFTVFGDIAVSQVKSLRVYSRWGELLFERSNFPANAPDYGWDGRFRGKPMGPGVFVWRAEIEFLDGAVAEEKGEVTIVR